MPERYVGVDVGGTKVATVAMHGGRFSRVQVAITQTAGAGALIDQLSALIRPYLPCEAVGIGVPGRVDTTRGVCRAAANLRLRDVPLADVLEEQLGVPVHLDNDAATAARAEAFDDAGRLTADLLVMFTVGTGVGSAVVDNGRVVRGSTGMTPELGHTYIGLDLTDGVPATRGEPAAVGTVERLASGNVLRAIATEWGYRDVAAFLDSARRGDARATGVLRTLGQRLGVGIANAINTFDPDLIVVGGRVPLASPTFFDAARETALRFALHELGLQPQIRLSRHGAEAGVRGAALMAAEAC